MFVKFIEYNMIVNINNTKSILTSKTAVNSSSQGVAEVLGNGEQILKS